VRVETKRMDGLMDRWSLSAAMCDVRCAKCDVQSAMLRATFAWTVDLE
jgi:hypothetical protein